MKGYKRVDVRVSPTAYPDNFMVQAFPYIYLAEDMTNYMSKYNRTLCVEGKPLLSTVSVDCPRGFIKYYIIKPSELFVIVNDSKLARRVYKKDDIFAEKKGRLYILKQGLVLR